MHHRSIAQELSSVQTQLEQNGLSKGEETQRATNAAIGGWANPEGQRGNDSTALCKIDAVSRLEKHIQSKETARRGGGQGMAPELTAKIRRNIQFLEECDW